jgi:WD repeat and SOF domain-containing protein 1
MKIGYYYSILCNHFSSSTAHFPMKIKVLSRQELDYTRERANDMFRIHHNPEPSIHPFERAREYTRALNATKLERVQAKPFLGSFEPGHTDGIYALAKHPHRVSTMASASADGHIHLWSLQNRRSRCYMEKAHQGFIRGLCFGNLIESNVNEPLILLSAGEDRVVRLWKFSRQDEVENEEVISAQVSDPENLEQKENYTTELEGCHKSLLKPLEKKEEREQTTLTQYKIKDPLISDPPFQYHATLAMSYPGQNAFYGIDHHRVKPLFTTSATTVQVWDESRSRPLQTYRWGADTIYTVRFNQVETSIIAAAGSDRTVMLYDLRMRSALRKAILDAKTNSIAWNPMEAFYFSTASEDHQIYTFDMRYLEHGALNVMKDHVSAVLDLDYDPTGQELVSGSYDRSIRIFKVGEGHSRDVYHTKRMQRVFCVRFTMDATYIVSGSDDTNLRLWKAKAWQKLGPMTSRERMALEYGQQLKQRFKHLPDIKRISRHRHLPKSIYSAAKLKRIMLEAESQRLENERKHRKEGTIPYRGERRKHHLSLQT